MPLDVLPADGLPQLADELAALYAACGGAERGCAVGGSSGLGGGGVGGVEVLEEGGGGEVGLCEEGEGGVGKVALLEVEVDEDVDLDAAQLHGGVGGVGERGGRGGGGGGARGGASRDGVECTIEVTPQSSQA